MENFKNFLKNKYIPIGLEKSNFKKINSNKLMYPRKEFIINAIYECVNGEVELVNEEDIKESILLIYLSDFKNSHAFNDIPKHNYDYFEPYFNSTLNDLLKLHSEELINAIKNEFKIFYNDKSYSKMNGLFESSYYSTIPNCRDENFRITYTITIPNTRYSKIAGTITDHDEDIRSTFYSHSYFNIATGIISHSIKINTMICYKDNRNTFKTINHSSFCLSEMFNCCGIACYYGFQQSNTGDGSGFSIMIDKKLAENISKSNGFSSMICTLAKSRKSNIEDHFNGKHALFKKKDLKNIFVNKRTDNDVMTFQWNLKNNKKTIKQKL